MNGICFGTSRIGGRMSKIGLRTNRKCCRTSRIRRKKCRIGCRTTK